MSPKRFATKIDTKSFKGIVHSKVLGLPMPVVALGAGAAGVWWWRRQQAREATGQLADSADAANAYSDTPTSTGAGGGGAWGSGGGVFVPTPIGVPPRPTGRPGRPRGRHGVIRKVVVHDATGRIQSIRRTWAGGTTVVHRRAPSDGGSPPRLHRVPPRTVPRRRKRAPRAQTSPMIPTAHVITGGVVKR